MGSKKSTDLFETKKNSLHNYLSDNFLFTVLLMYFRH